MNFNKVWLFVALTLSVLSGCKEREAIMAKTDKEICLDWAKLSLEITKNTKGNSPTYASRCLGYLGLTMYETLVHGSLGYISMEGQLNGLENLPQPSSGKMYDWLEVMNAGHAFMLKNLYIQTADSNVIKIDSLEALIFNSRKAMGSSEKTLNDSRKLGQEIATSIFDWAKTDKGHRAYLKNFDKSLENKSFPGCWKPPLYGQSFSRFPLHPHWGDNRTFSKENQNLPLPDFIPFDTIPGSPYYEQFMAVYHKRNELSDDDKKAAVWWGDDPDETYTPPGHSYFLATLALEQKDLSAIEMARIYAELGMSLADAFINCWKWKYHFFSERPNTFINEHVDVQWESFWPDPPFPAFPSGHAIQAASCATILSHALGDSMHIVDITHVGRKPDKLRNTPFTARTYESFWDIARETANSRFYGGIHTPQDNEVGLEQGQIIASNIYKLKWHE